MDSCCLPVLACHSVQEQLLGSPFEVEIYKAGSYAPLKNLAHTKDGSYVPQEDLAQAFTKDGSYVPQEDLAQAYTEDGSYVPLEDLAQAYTNNGSYVPLEDLAQAYTKDGSYVPQEDLAQAYTKDGSYVPQEDLAQAYTKDGSYVPLEDLAQAYARCGGRTVDDGSELTQYLLPTSGGGHNSYLWYWESEDGFNPYGVSVSELLERALPSKGSIMLSIGRNDYEVDTCSMTQTNTSTKRVRLIERRLRRFISVQIRAHSNHLQEVPGFIRECLLRNMKETAVSVPLVCQDTNSIDHLLEVAQRWLIFAQKTADNGILLQGEKGVVTEVELELTKEIMRMKEASKTPDNWETQECACELKLVGHQTAEWNGIEQRMTEPGFCAEVLRIERIQNQWLWEMYEQSRKRMSDKNGGEVNEKWLFHGTKNIHPVKIYNSEQGFDNRLSSQGMWGEGTYFADKAKYSAGFAYATCDGHKQIFLVRVLVGITFRCPPDRCLRAPPKKSDHLPALHGSGSMFEDERYDSVSGSGGCSEIFVTYEHGRSYPAYLITYT